MFGSPTTAERRSDAGQRSFVRAGQRPNPEVQVALFDAQWPPIIDQKGHEGLRRAHRRVAPGPGARGSCRPSPVNTKLNAASLRLASMRTTRRASRGNHGLFAMLATSRSFFASLLAGISMPRMAAPSRISGLRPHDLPRPVSVLLAPALRSLFMARPTAARWGTGSR